MSGCACGCTHRSLRVAAHIGLCVSACACTCRSVRVSVCLHTQACASVCSGARGSGHSFVCSSSWQPAGRPARENGNPAASHPLPGARPPQSRGKLHTLPGAGEVAE